MGEVDPSAEPTMIQNLLETGKHRLVSLGKSHNLKNAHWCMRQLVKDET